MYSTTLLAKKKFLKNTLDLPFKDKKLDKWD